MADDHGNSKETSSNLSLGRTTSATFDTRDDTDYFRLSLAENTTYRFEFLDYRSGGGTAHGGFRVLGPSPYSQYFPTYDWIAGSYSLELTTQQSGDYYFVAYAIATGSSRDMGTYSVRVQADSPSSRDIERPSITWFEPDEVSMRPGSKIRFGLNEFVKDGDGTIDLLASSGHVVASFGTDDASVNINGSRVWLDVGSLLHDNTAYRVRINGGALEDYSGNDIRPTEMQFTTESSFFPNLGSWSDDVLTARSGRDVYGNGGVDTLVVPGRRSDWSLQSSGDKWSFVHQRAEFGSFDAYDIHALRFDDISVDLVAPRPTSPQLGADPYLTFDAVYYLLSNPVLATVRTVETARAHYADVGQQRGLAPNAWFDADSYGTYADLAAHDFTDDVLFQHFNLYGVWEGRAPNQAMRSFDGARYLNDNTDVGGYVRANVNDFLGSETNGAIAHFLIYGQHEGREAFEVSGNPIDLGYII